MYYFFLLILVELFMWIILNQSSLIFLIQKLHDRWADELINTIRAVDMMVLQKLSSAALKAWREDVCHPRNYSAISLQFGNRNLDWDFQPATWKFPTTAAFQLTFLDALGLHFLTKVPHAQHLSSQRPTRVSVLRQKCCLPAALSLKILCLRFLHLAQSKWRWNWASRGSIHMVVGGGTCNGKNWNEKFLKYFQ